MPVEECAAIRLAYILSSNIRRSPAGRGVAAVCSWLARVSDAVEQAAVNDVIQAQGLRAAADVSATELSIRAE